ncbi:MAG: HNH endonuclease, partial [Planctomycetaceae bacterium]
ASSTKYCLFRQEHDGATLHVEHILAEQHGGSDDPSNLTLACIHCDPYKNPQLKPYLASRLPGRPT